MKTQLLLLLTLLFSSYSYSQSGDPKVDEMIKKLQQKNTNATITFAVNAKNYTDFAMTDTSKKGVYRISSSLLYDETPNTTIVLCFKGQTSGTHPFGEKNDGSLLMLNGKVYELKGTLKTTINGAKAVGSFSGDLYLVQSKNGKADTKSSGKIKGTFKI